VATIALRASEDRAAESGSGHQRWLVCLGAVAWYTWDVTCRCVSSWETWAKRGPSGWPRRRASTCLARGPLALGNSQRPGHRPSLFEQDRALVLDPGEDDS